MVLLLLCLCLRLGLMEASLGIRCVGVSVGYGHARPASKQTSTFLRNVGRR